MLKKILKKIEKKLVKNVETRDKMEISESSDDNASEKNVCEADKHSQFLCLTQDEKAKTGARDDIMTMIK